MNFLRKIRIMETHEHRYLGAIRFLDNATGQVISHPLTIVAPGLTFFQNKSGLTIIRDAEGLSEYTKSFTAPPPPETIPIESFHFVLNISDPLGQYMPREFDLYLPRNPLPDIENSIFNPIDVPMYPSPIASRGLNWSVVRLSLYHNTIIDREEPVGGALLRIFKPGVEPEENVLLQKGISDTRGEVLIVIPGIPVTTFANEAVPDDDTINPDDWLASGPVVETSTAAAIECIVQPSLPWPVNPELLDSNRSIWLRTIRTSQEIGDELENSINIDLKTGQSQNLKLFVHIPEIP